MIIKIPPYDQHQKDDKRNLIILTMQCGGQSKLHLVAHVVEMVANNVIHPFNSILRETEFRRDNVRRVHRLIAVALAVNYH